MRQWVCLSSPQRSEKSPDVLALFFFPFSLLPSALSSEALHESIPAVVAAASGEETWRLCLRKKEKKEVGGGGAVRRCEKMCKAGKLKGLFKTIMNVNLKGREKKKKIHTWISEQSKWAPPPWTFKWSKQDQKNFKKEEPDKLLQFISNSRSQENSPFLSYVFLGSQHSIHFPFQEFSLSSSASLSLCGLHYQLPKRNVYLNISFSEIDTSDFHRASVSLLRSSE